MADGVLSVTMNGMKLMQLLHADNWAIPHGVSFSDQKCTNDLLYVCRDTVHGAHELLVQVKL